MARGAIAYKGQLYLGGSKVEANPIGSATDELEKISIDDTNYSIKDTKAREDITEVDTVSTTPFLYRQTPYNADGVFVDKLVGGSVAWNQLLVSEHKQHSYNSTSDQSTYDIIVATSLNIPIIQGHKYLLSAKMTRTISGNNMIGLVLWSQNAASQAMIIWNNGDANGYKQAIFLPYSNQTSFQKIAFNNYSGKIGFTAGDTMEYDDFNVIDLTQMFGTTIADYIYSLEQATAGSGIAWLKSHGFFTKDYYPYNTGELISVKTSGKKYVGKNRWLLSARYTSSVDGDWVQSDASISLPAGTYTLSLDDETSGKASSFYFKNSSNTQIASVDVASNGSRAYRTFTITEPASVVAVCMYGTARIINNIQLEEGSAATPYEPYTEHAYDISNIDLRGIPNLVNNELVYDGDTYDSNGDVTRKYGIVDLGSLSWTKAGNNFYATNAVSDRKFANCLALCEKYTHVLDVGSASETMTDKTFAFQSNQLYIDRIIIYDSAYTDATTFTNAMSGVYLAYELATSTTETATPYTSPQICDKDGTEEFIDDRTVPIPVGHNSCYADLPAIMDGDYLSYMARNFASEEYVDRRMDALGDLAYINEDGDNSTKFLRGDGTWQNTPAGVTTLSALTDTTISSPSNGQVLKYNGSKWVNSADYSLPTASAGTLGGVKVGANLSIDANGVLSATGGGATALNDLTDVSAASPTNKQVLAYDSSQSKWVAVDADVVAIPRSYWSSTTRELDFMITVPAYNTQRILKFSLMHAAGLAASEYMFALDRGDVYSSKMAGDTCGISSSYESSTHTYTIKITMPSVSGSPNFIFAMTMYNGSDKTW